jgi:chromosome partitioning protein
MVIVFGGIKGGTGKSTLAVNMAVWSNRPNVVLYDGDPQRTTTHFIEFRLEQENHQPGMQLAFTYSPLKHLSLTQHLKQDASFDYIVDVGGRDTTVQREAMTLADVLVVPMALSGFDVWPLQELLGLVEQARDYNPKLKLSLVANRCDYRGPNTAAYREVEQALAEMGLKFQGLVTDRVVYSRTTALGYGVFDADLPANLRDEKAKAELGRLFDDILATATHETT